MPSFFIFFCKVARCILKTAGKGVGLGRRKAREEKLSRRRKSLGLQCAGYCSQLVQRIHRRAIDFLDELVRHCRQFLRQRPTVIEPAGSSLILEL